MPGAVVHREYLSRGGVLEIALAIGRQWGNREPLVIPVSLLVPTVYLPRVSVFCFSLTGGKKV